MNADFNGKRLLLVEDHPDVRAVVGRLLDRLGFEVEMQSSADDAITSLAGSPDGHFDVVISDLRMRGSLDGQGLVRWIDQHCPKTPAVLMSAYPGEHLQLPAVFLPKPFTESELVDTLRLLFETPSRV